MTYLLVKQNKALQRQIGKCKDKLNKKVRYKNPNAALSTVVELEEETSSTAGNVFHAPPS